MFDPGNGSMLHLIIHREMIESELKSELTHPSRRRELETVLDRIREVELKERYVKWIEFDRADPDNVDLDGIHFVVDICAEHSSVRLY